MNEDFYENEIRKNMNQIDTLNSTAEISNDGKELHSIVDKMGEAITNTEKNIKDYSLYNMMNNNNDQTKTKPLERKLTDSKRRWKKLREKLKLLKKNNHNLNSINQETDEETSQSIRFNSFNKLQQATRSTIEMENMSGNILGDLNNQSSQMKNVSSKIGLINDDIDSSNTVLNKMFSRQSRDKKIIIIFGLILMLIFLGTLTYKIVTKFNK
jgi:predicted RNase H-like nuclease (RuvC/YqgF family)